MQRALAAHAPVMKVQPRDVGRRTQTEPAVRGRALLAPGGCPVGRGRRCLLRGFHGVNQEVFALYAHVVFVVRHAVFNPPEFGDVDG